ncbi:MAG: histidine kinase [Alphaproteobacteria bacterium HGW-Alphaproteobacteria-8]|nr:MAG: histidine kinase [Alphaproteobacteria bacterium HGW-Alphaproteobacteria-8]
MTVTAILKQKGSTKIVTIRPDATMEECVRMLAQYRIGALVVSDDGAHIAGIVSERDVVKVLAQHGGSCLTRKVSTVMTGAVEGCTPSDRALDILHRMTRGRFRHMPVLNKDGELAALISIGDVVKYRISEIEMEKMALEDMIRGT